MFLQIVQIAYWLALSTWFGGGMFIAIAAPIIFRTVRESNPVMTDVLSVNLEGQHATLLSGSIVSNLLARLAQIEIVCAIIILVSLIPQFMTSEWNLAIIRCVLCLAAAGVAAYDHFFIWPRLRKAREEFIEHADEPELANPAKERFDREHRLSVTLLMVTLALLLMLVMQSVSYKTVVPLQTDSKRV